MGKAEEDDHLVLSCDKRGLVRALNVQEKNASYLSGLERLFFYLYNSTSET